MHAEVVEKLDLALEPVYLGSHLGSFGALLDGPE